MTAFSLTQPEIRNQLRVNIAKRERIANEKKKLSAEETRIADEKAKLRAAEQKIAEKKESLSLDEAALGAEDAALLAQLQELDTLDGVIPAVLLEFDTASRTIYWNGSKSVQLTETKYKIIHALYFAKKRRMLVTNFEQKVWEDKTPRPGTVKSTVCQLNKILKEANCPCKVKSVNCKKETIQIKNPLTKKVQETTIRPATSGYKLLFRRF